MAAELPADLRELLARGRQVLDGRDDGELPLPERRAIRERLGPFDPVDSAQAPPGLRRRVRLGELAARHVLGAWYADRPGDDSPERLLALANAVLDGTVDREDARRQAHRFLDAMQQMDDLGDTGATAGEAARKVVLTAVAGDASDRSDAPSEEEIEPSDWDPTFVAALAAAGYPDEDTGRRRDYWRWYLDEAVPEAWAGA
jgi:hypothetical protein